MSKKKAIIGYNNNAQTRRENSGKPGKRDD